MDHSCSQSLKTLNPNPSREGYVEIASVALSQQSLLRHILPDIKKLVETQNYRLLTDEPLRLNGGGEQNGVYSTTDCHCDYLLVIDLGVYSELTGSRLCVQVELHGGGSRLVGLGVNSSRKFAVRVVNYDLERDALTKEYRLPWEFLEVIETLAALIETTAKSLRKTTRTTV
ncbi:MAG TPA: hypothetical protein VLI05_06920 [Candidatus Saccharimonadia bacterium]|nr:hypothetical protein [Candidatus Saccharimonadia bacterium]